MTLIDLRLKRREFKEQGMAIIERATQAQRELSEDEQQAFDELVEKVEALDRRIAALEKLEGPATESSRDWRFDFAQHNGKHGYSLLRAVRSMLESGRLEGVEAEAHQEIQRRKGVAPQRGFYVPHTLNVRADLTTTNGAGAVMTNTTADYIELLRNASISDKLGVTWLKNLYGNVRIPRQTASATTGWISESSAISGSTPTLDYVSLQPKSLMANVSYSRQFLLTSSVDAEKFVTDDLILSTARELDRVILSGSGSGAEPTGLFGSSPSTVAIGTNGGALTWTHVVQLEKNVRAANGVVNEATAKYLTNAQVVQTCKTTAKIGSTYPQFLIEPDGTMNGHEVVTSQVVPSNLSKGSASGTLSAIAYGDWSQVLIGSFGDGFELVIDPYSQADKGFVRIVSVHDLDVAFRHIGSFSVCLDVLP